jgi:hypothetical protein
VYHVQGHPSASPANISPRHDYFSFRRVWVDVLELYRIDYEVCFEDRHEFA